MAGYLPEMFFFWGGGGGVRASPSLNCFQREALEILKTQERFYMYGGFLSIDQTTRTGGSSAEHLKMLQITCM